MRRINLKLKIRSLPVELLSRFFSFEIFNRNVGSDLVILNKWCKFNVFSCGKESRPGIRRIIYYIKVIFNIIIFTQT